MGIEDNSAKGDRDKYLRCVGPDKGRFWEVIVEFVLLLTTVAAKSVVDNQGCHHVLDRNRNYSKDGD